MKGTVYICMIIALLCVSCIEAKKDSKKVLQFETAWPNINIYYPVDMDYYDGFVYVTSLGGQVYRFANNDAVTEFQMEVFLDLTSGPLDFFTNFYIGGDDGLTSMEFHPRYPSVPKLYTFHCSSSNNIQITAWTVVNGAVDYSSADVLLNIPKPDAKVVHGSYGDIYEAYLGGDLRFLAEQSDDSDSNSSSDSHESQEDDDGNQKRSNNNLKYNLYISVGYGNDDTSAQNLQNYLGKILRITPKTHGTGYTVPTSNPYVYGKLASAGLDEIYARGFRNPRKIYFSEDPEDLFVGDVGAAWDEIDRVSATAQNFGWGNFDGCGGYTSKSQYTFPVYTYTDEFAPHTVTLGPYYNGPIKSIRDKLLFADLYSGQVYAIQTTNTKECKTVPVPVASAPAIISSFLTINDVVYVSNVFGAFYGSPNFYRLVEVPAQ